MLGLTLWSLNFFQSNNDMLGAVAFVLSLGFKQMALYYSPAMYVTCIADDICADRYLSFAYLLGKCLWLGGPEGYVNRCTE